MKRKLKERPDVWSKDVAFYLDGVSLVYKSNPLSTAKQPKARVWRRQSEGLTVTAKGSKDLAGDRRLHASVAISYGKGVVLREAYETMNRSFFASFVREKFRRKKHRLFVMNNDPSQVLNATKLVSKISMLSSTKFKITSNTTALDDLLPPRRTRHLRSRGHDYILPRVRTSRFKSTFVNRCLFSIVCH